MSFWHFWLGNVLRAATACNFSSLIRPAGSAPAALARLLFDPPEPQIIGKTQWIATSLPFSAPASSFFWLSPSLIFSLLDFSSLTLPTSTFPSLHTVGSLTSKLPSIKQNHNTLYQYSFMRRHSKFYNKCFFLQIDSWIVNDCTRAIETKNHHRTDSDLFQTTQLLLSFLCMPTWKPGHVWSPQRGGGRTPWHRHPQIGHPTNHPTILPWMDGIATIPKC